MPDYTQEQLLSFGWLHDFDHPESQLNKIEMVYLAALRSLPECPHCHVDYQLVPMQGTAWGLEHHHEDGCPDAEG